MWQIVLANISIEGRVVNTDVYCFFYGPGHVLLLPTYNLEVVYCCSMVNGVLMINICVGAFRYSLYHTSNALADSPMYSSLYSVLPYLNQYMMLLCLVVASLSFGKISKLVTVFPALKCTWTPYLLQMVL